MILRGISSDGKGRKKSDRTVRNTLFRRREDGRTLSQEGGRAGAAYVCRRRTFRCMRIGKIRARASGILAVYNCRNSMQKNGPPWIRIIRGGPFCFSPAGSAVCPEGECEASVVRRCRKSAPDAPVRSVADASRNAAVSFAARKGLLCDYRQVRFLAERVVFYRP